MKNRRADTPLRRFLAAAALSALLAGAPPARAEEAAVPRLERHLVSLPNRRLPVKISLDVLDADQAPALLVRFENDRPGGSANALFIRYDQVDRVSVAGFFREDRGDRRVYAYDVTSAKNCETVDYVRVEYELDGDRAYLVDRPVVLAAQSRLVGQ